MGLWSWDEDRQGKVMIALAIIIAFLIFVQVSKMDDAKNAVHIGTVTDKKIINAEQGFFTSSDKRYQLVISIEYEYRGKTFTAEIKVDVDKDVYLSYDVGDLFDIHNPVPKQDDTSTISEEAKY